MRRDRPAPQVTQEVGTAHVGAAPLSGAAPDVSRKTPGSEGAGVPSLRMFAHRRAAKGRRTGGTYGERRCVIYVIQPPMRSSSFSSDPVSGHDPFVGTSWLRAAPESVCEETPDVSDVDSEELPRIVVERVAAPPPPVLVGDPTHLGADLVVRAPVKSATFMYSSVPDT